MQHGTSTRPTAILTALLEALPGKMPKGVEVVEGDKPGEQPDDALIVAPSTPDIPGMVVTWGPTTNRQPAEQTEIALVARSYAGDNEMGPRRERCAAIIGAVQAYIKDTPVLEQRWDKIEMGPTALWHPVWTDKGCNCYVGFSVVATGLL